MAELTYDGILKEMKKAFFDETGTAVENISDLGARFQTVASELYSVLCYGDFVLKQAFPQTATGNYLDNHAQLRGIERFAQTKAQGEVTFSLDEVSKKDVEIPKGIVCSLKDEPFIQFVTTQSGVIPAGELTVTVPAQALESGYSHNVSAGKINVIVNPPSAVSWVNNDKAFVGGCDKENDYSLRKRLISAYKVLPTGFNLESFRQVILKNENILDCYISKNENSLKICVKTVDSTLEKSLIEEIENAMYSASLMGLSLDIFLATPLDCDITVCVDCVDKNDDIIHLVKNEIEEYANAVKIGENLDLSLLGQHIAKLNYVKGCNVYSTKALNSIIYSSNSQYLKLSDLKVE